MREGTVETGHIRTKGFDFREGDTLLAAGRRLGPREISLAAAMGHGRSPSAAARALPSCRPATNWCRRAAGSAPARSSASNHLGVAALAEAAGAAPQQLGIARDTRADLDAHFARAHGADVIVTIGGASVGDHDLVGPVLEERGMTLAFWKIAMRPGKPLMFGRLGQSRVLGLPGNPVSSLICTRLFLLPLIRALLGQPAGRRDARCRPALGVPLEANGPRAALHARRLQPRPRRPARGDPCALPGQLPAGAAGRGRLPAGSRPPARLRRLLAASCRSCRSTSEPRSHLATDGKA